MHARLKKHAPAHVDKLKMYTQNVKHGSEWVRDSIETNHHSFKETVGLFASSDIHPESAVGEVLGQIDHHVEKVHSLTGKIGEYAEKAHETIENVEEVVGGGFKENVKTGAIVARKGLRTAAKIAETTALPAELLGLATGNAALVEYGELAPLVGEGARVAAYGIGQAVKTL